MFGVRARASQLRDSTRCGARMKIEAWLEDETASGAVGSAALLTGDSTHGRCRCRIKMVETGVACSGGESRARDHRWGQVLPRSAPAPPRSVADWVRSISGPVTLEASPLVVDRTAIMLGEQNDGGTIENTCMRAES
ncbi:hypothetical protein OPV22_002174 [Ensete ventricosum]|uniref:Uncharacterized protein n=1 Tax=Ensete ventricosum TaxID=4639 RepID=A0AAV8RX63_ENSVE|nr:hypothetical protein OPV22_002174 [Ensete ventricosum]